MVIRTAPSMRLTPRLLLTQRSKKPPMTMGSKKNSTTEKPIPKTAAAYSSPFWNFSDPSFFSSQRSSLEGFSVSLYSSGDKSAERSRALMPTICAEKKFTTPRINGQVATEPGLGSFLSVTSVVRPSFPRTTTASFSGPRIIIPSINACPPIMVLNFSLVFCLLMGYSFPASAARRRQNYC